MLMPSLMGLHYCHWIPLPLDPFSYHSYIPSSSPRYFPGTGRLGQSSPTLSEVTHLELLVVVGADVQQVHRQDTERYILTNLNIVSRWVESPGGGRD